MDLLVHWDNDDTENVVAADDVTVVDQLYPKKGATVKMWWPETKTWWMGHVVDVEIDYGDDSDEYQPSEAAVSSDDTGSPDDSSEDEEPLAKLVRPSQSADLFCAVCASTVLCAHCPECKQVLCNDHLYSDGPCPGHRLQPAMVPDPVHPSDPQPCAACGVEIFAACTGCDKFLCQAHFEAHDPCPFESLPEPATSPEICPGGLSPTPRANDPSPNRHVSPASPPKTFASGSSSNLADPDTTRIFHRVSDGPAPEPERPVLAKKRSNPEAWKRNVTKRRHEQRLQLLETYWGLASHDNKLQYILRSIESRPIKQKSAKPKDGDIPSGKSESHYYSFTTEKNVKVPVCKSFFMSTLGITEGLIKSALKKRGELGTVNPDQRGQHGSQDKPLFIRARALAKPHILSFPTVESHYLREHTSWQYLTSDLDISTMHRMYSEWLKVAAQAEKFSHDQLKVKLVSYWKIFNSMKLSFFKPKKDQCALCESSKVNKEVKESDAFKEHESNKEAARYAKDQIKAHLKEDETLACFDLQQVLSCPHGNIGDIFYKRQLSCYNLTVYDVGTKKGYCYFWTEEQAGRGPDEIATAVYTFLQGLAPNKRTVYLFCDSTSSQNRNTVMAAMLGYAVWAEKSRLQTIRLHYFEKNHGQNEGDSVHSVIEKRKKKVSITVPSQYVTLIQMSKVVDPYEVVEFDHTSVFSFTQLAKDLSIKLSRDTVLATGDPGPKMNWNQLKVLEAHKEKTGSLSVKLSYTSDFLSLPLKKQRGRSFSLIRYQLQPLYPTPVGIDKDKKKDLLSLFDKVIRTKKDKEYYEGLVTRSEKKKQGSGGNRPV